MVTSQETTLPRYADFAPTGFDAKGLALPDRQDWLLCPVMRTRDSDNLTQSNWAAQLARLGGESETVEVRRFGHWGPGWFEVVLIDPTDETRVCDMESLRHELAQYGVMDEQDYWERENAEYLRSWAKWANRDFIALLKKRFELSTDTEWSMYDIEPETMRALYESLIPSGDYHTDGSPTASRLESACSRLTRPAFTQWLKDNRPRKATKI